MNIAGSPVWLKDGSFLWLSGRPGCQHIFHYSHDWQCSRARSPAASGKCATVYGVDETAGLIYFRAARSAARSEATSTRIKLDGSRLTRLSQAPGTHSASFNPSFTEYVGTWSDINTPTQARLTRPTAPSCASIDRNDVPTLKH